MLVGSNADSFGRGRGKSLCGRPHDSIFLDTSFMSDAYLKFLCYFSICTIRATEYNFMDGFALIHRSGSQ